MLRMRKQHIKNLLYQNYFQLNCLLQYQNEQVGCNKNYNYNKYNRFLSNQQCSI